MKAANCSIAVRVDASLEIGTGHVMRCLTLAEALRKEGAEITFVSREAPGNMIDVVESKGFRVIRLPEPDGPVPEGPPMHAPWAGVSWQRDAEETDTALSASTLDWLVIDHYAFDERWEKKIRRDGMQIMAIDDIADRPHHCELLLDQNLGREPDDYGSLVPDHCKLLIGPTYALLRPEFAELREKSLARRRFPRLKRLLITMGGMDKDNATAHVLDALRGCSLPDDLTIDVVVGGKAPWLEAVQERAASMPWPTHVHVKISDMARRMVTADLAIGATGSTTWERCCLGLPTISVITAENQRNSAAALERFGAVRIARNVADSDCIREAIRSLVNNKEALREMSVAASAISDGLGLRRVTNSISEAA